MTQHLNLVIYFLLGLILTVGLAPIWIPYFKKLKFGQFVREEGPQSHHKKTGTPIFGGIIFTFSVVVGLIILGKFDLSLLAILFGTIGYGIIGFADDYTKVVKKHNLGLKASQKIIGQISVACLLYIFFFKGHTSAFYGELFTISSPVIWFFVFVFIAIGTTNSVNLNDGVDGLCASVTLVIVLFFSLYAYRAGMQNLVMINLLMAGGLVGYLFYNWHPAKVFMGDTGSLALGGFVLTNAVLLNIEWFIPLFGIVYVIEALSVIIQVGYFKLTGGKRFFKMSPIHHHFELVGWSEVKIVMVASFTTALFCFLTYILVI